MIQLILLLDISVSAGVSNEYYFIDGILELRINPWLTSKLEHLKRAFILIPDWKDSYNLLVQKFSFLFNTSTIHLIEAPKKNKIYQRKSRSKNVQLIETYTKSSKRSYILTFKNTPLLESEALFTSVYKEMMKYFKGKLKWNNKVIIAQTLVKGRTYSLHQNIKVNNKTTAKEYWNLIKDSIQQNYDKDYLIEIYPIVKLLVWNLEDKRNKKITVHKNNSKLSLEERWESIKKKYPFINKRKFSTTISPLNKRTFSTMITPLRKDSKLNSFIIFNKDLLIDISALTVKFIFVHDLDNSIFSYIHNQLLIKFDHNLIEVVQDKNNNFIYIRIFSIKFINSHRIFPITESELIDLFKGPAAAPDLYDSLVNAQLYYFHKFNLDITTIVSTGSLAFKLFRINFLMKYNSIPILSKSLDSIIRKSYFGGGVHVFKLNKIIKNVYHYDINSLYPFAMLKPLPFKFIKSFVPDNNNWSLNDKFFGFIKVEVTISSNCNKILLPHRIDDKIVHSSGTFIETFFSEEIKLYLGNKNYKFRYLECYEFSKFYPFKDYVNTFYKIKAESKGLDRAIAKLLLNNLYGFFGRSYQLLKTFKINNDEINTFMNETEDMIINIQQFESYSLIKLIEINDNYQIKSNVAISSAITSWARIIMYPYLMLPYVIYSDTDSVFTSKPLNPKIISKAIGYFKDEMNGIIIKEFISKGPKRYAYWFLDDNNQRIERSVYAGLERNSIKFNTF
jgi:DNA polymerase type B, organellar and viral